MTLPLNSQCIQEVEFQAIYYASLEVISKCQKRLVGWPPHPALKEIENKLA